MTPNTPHPLLFFRYARKNPIDLSHKGRGEESNIVAFTSPLVGGEESNVFVFTSLLVGEVKKLRLLNLCKLKLHGR